jgi:hypothetical protein
MQITLNKVPFDIRPVEGRLREALLAEPAVAAAASRDVWARDEAGERFLVPVTDRKGVALPPGLLVFVPRPGPEGGAPQKADGPTRRMAERLMGALGAKSFAPVMQALARVTGIPQKTVPFEAFAALKDHGPYRIRLLTEYAVVELSNPGRNLQAFLCVPGLVSFVHGMDEVPEGAPAPGSIRPGFVIPPLNQAVHAIRRMAVARALTEMQAELGEVKPTDLAANDPRRARIAKLGAEWKVLQAKPAKAA